MNKRTLILLLVLIAFGCKSKKELKVNYSGNECVPLLIESYKMDESKILPVDSIFVSNKCLGVIIPTYCKSKNYELKWNEMMLKSMPPKVSFYLEETTSTSCDAPATEVLFWDISQLSNHSKVYVRVNNSKSVLVDFEIKSD